MAVKFDTTKVTPQSTEPQLTSFTGVGDGSLTGAYRNDCAKLLRELNVETARYSALVAALGTTIDTEGLRKRLKISRVRVWERAVDMKNKLLPLIRRKQIKMECCEELDRMFRILAACLEFLEELYRTTLSLQVQFSLQTETQTFINTGLSEASIPKKGPDKDKQGSNDVTSIRSISSDIKSVETEDIRCLQKELNDMHDLVFSLNYKIAIQTWEVDPEVETEKFTVNMDSEVDGTTRTSVNDDTSSLDSDHRKMRCITIFILAIILIVIGGIVGILMGMLD